MSSRGPLPAAYVAGQAAVVPADPIRCDRQAQRPEEIQPVSKSRSALADAVRPRRARFRRGRGICSGRLRGKDRRARAQGRATHDGTRSPQKNAAPAPREQRRQLFDHQRPDGCSIRRGCQVIDLPRSTFYYRQSLPQSTVSDLRLVELIGSIQDELPGYRYRRVTAELRRRGMVINHERISRVMKAHRGARGRSPRRQPPGRG